MEEENKDWLDPIVIMEALDDALYECESFSELKDRVRRISLHIEKTDMNELFESLEETQ